MNINVQPEISNEDGYAAAEIEPVAIIGMSCRFPGGANTPEEFWQLLLDGRVTVGDLPQKRWGAYSTGSPKVSGILEAATRRGSFLDDIEGFDADFFGISSREAEYIDPQQRIILELSWEALERSGILPNSLRGSDVGVYVAANSFDYGHRLMSNLTEIQPWTMNGSMLFGIANRISYALDFRGPSMVVDTACAGSLTVLHLACQALWRNEIPLAIVGGVNLMSNPGMMLALDAAGATAKDGRSKAFDMAANGYGRGEGAGLVVLKRLSQAQADGDMILAVVRGGGVFQDGRTAGMMAPNAQAQEAMLRKIYARFGIEPASVSYVEAHGTGTQAGDQAEVGSLSHVFGANRDQPCYVGSAKPNIGHLEAGAGIAGLIKTVLALQNDTIPPSVHDHLNQNVDWAKTGLKVVGEPVAWKQTSTPRRAGVSCFGVGGVISHTILEEAPNASALDTPEAGGRETLPLVVPISGRSSAGLRENASRLADWIEKHPSTSLGSIGYTLSKKRDHLSKRAAISCLSKEELVSSLREVAEDAASGSSATGEVVAGAEKGAVWVFSGHGAQWPTMAQELLANNSHFAAVIDQLGPIFKEELGYTAREAIDESDWSTVERIQALTFAIQVSLAEVWKRYGLEPGAVIGHSVGEVAAAVVAGSLQLEDAAVFACRRAAIYQCLAGNGAMAMARLTFEEAEEKLRETDRVVAAISASTNATVISGDTDVLDSIIRSWKKEKIVVRKVSAIDAAFHSPQIDPLLADIREAAAHLQTKPAVVPLYNTTLEDPRDIEDRGADFWATNSRGAVHLTNAVTEALADGFTAFLEVSTSPIVAPSIRETLDLLNRDDVLVTASLLPNKPEMGSLALSLASLFVHGCPVNWDAIYHNQQFADLPVQAWQHKPYWPEFDVASSGSGFGHSPASHTLLGKAEHIRSTPSLTVWKTQLDYTTRPYPGTHPLFGVEIVPAAALLHTLMKAGGGDHGLAELVDINLYTPVPVDNPLQLQIVQQGQTINIASRREDVGTDSSWAWTHHTAAHLQASTQPTGVLKNKTGLDERCTEAWNWEKVDVLYQKRGIGDYGFPWEMLELRRGDDGIVSSFESREFDEAKRSWAEILDATLTICPLLLPDDTLLRMPSRIGRVTVFGDLPAKYAVYAFAKTRDVNDEKCLIDVEILNEAGDVVGVMTDILFSVLDGARDLSETSKDTVFVESWVPYSGISSPGEMPANVTFVGALADCPEMVCSALQRAAIPYEFVSSPEHISTSKAQAVVVLGSAIQQDEDIYSAASRNAWTLINTAQTLAAPNFQDLPIRLFCVTQNVKQLDDEAALAQSGLWGASRIIAGERPDLWGGLIDIGRGALKGQGADALAAAFGKGVQEDVVSLYNGEWSALRLVSAEQGDHSEDDGRIAESCRPNATYLVTGGMGALGLEAAKFLAEKGARRIVLAGRTGLPPRSSWSQVTDPAHRKVIDDICEIEESGVSITPISVDVNDEEALRRELSRLEEILPPIKGVVHSAGAFEGGMIGQISPESLQKNFAAKVSGAINLHRLFPDDSVDFLILFSSSGQLARLTGQSCYAAANSFLDGLAKLRNGGGSHRSLSLSWMAWKGLGMSRSIDATMIEARAQGIDAIDVSRAIRAWGEAETLGVPYAAIFTPLFEAGDLTLPVFEALVPVVEQETQSDTGKPQIPTEGRLPWLVDDIRRLVAVELKATETELEVRRPLIDMGVDSLMTVSLRARLRKRYGFEFPPTLLWNSPSVSAIADFVDQNLEHEDA